MSTKHTSWLRMIRHYLLSAVMFLCSPALPLYASQTYALGGDEVIEQEIGGTRYRIHVFTNIGAAELDVRLGGPIDYLVVAGGGGGGGRQGGGGGAGGVVMREGDVITPAMYPVVVGDGGAGGGGHGQDGADSSFFDSLALGGGGGGVQGAAPNYPGNDGGSGGGRGAQSLTPVVPRVGMGLQPLQPGKSAGYGNDGYETSSSIGSGGGGAGAPGGVTDGGRSGGAGIDVSHLFDLLVGESGYVGGGGAGNGSGSGDTTSGGIGGGGGSVSGGVGQDALPKTGGGGGGGSDVPIDQRLGGAGGSGIVAIRYEFEESDFYIHLPFYYADRDTGSREFTNSNTVDVVEFPLPLDYDRYQITESGDIGAIDPGAWISTSIPYTELTFPQPAGNATITRYVWFTNSTASVFLLRGQGEINYTEVLPVPLVKPSLTRQAGGFTFRILPEEIDDGSTGGLFDGQPIGIHQMIAHLESGPAPDLTPNEPYVTLQEPGEYELSLTVINEAGNVATSTVNCVVTLEALPPSPPGTRHVAIHNLHPMPPYTNWYTAATSIQDAVDYAETNDLVLVAAGRYLAPTNAVENAGTNVVYIDMPLILRSIDGRGVTVIDGEGVNRGLYIDNTGGGDNVFEVTGFTITNGFTTSYGAGLRMRHNTATGTAMVYNCSISGNYAENSGAGIYSEGNSGATFLSVFSNCVVSGNTVPDTHGGGLYVIYGLLSFIDCEVSENQINTGAYAGAGMYAGHLTEGSLIRNCVFDNNDGAGRAGGLGVAGGLSIDQTVFSNNKGGYGGGVGCTESAGNPWRVSISNSLFYGNVSARGGAMDVFSGLGVTIESSTIVSNRSTASGDSAGGVLARAGTTMIRNSIVYHNLGPRNDFMITTGNTLTLTNVCATTNNAVEGGTLIANTVITDPPLFVDFDTQNYHLATNSPCRDAGLYQVWMDDATDLDGNPRIMQGVVDIGCYERPDFSMTADPLTLADQMFAGNSFTNLAVEITAAGAFTDPAGFTLLAEPAAPWLRPTSTNETLTPPFPQSVTVDLATDARALAPGSHTGLVSVAVTNAGLSNYDYNWSNDVTVTLNLAGLAAAPNTLSNTVVQGQDAAQQSFEVISSGIGEFAYTVATTSAWVTATPASGILTDDMTNGTDIIYTTAGLAPGRHTAQFEIASTNWGGATQYVYIVLDVLGLEIEPTSISNRVFQGYGMADRTLTVTNLGSGVFSYTIATNQPWLSVTPASGTAAVAAVSHTLSFDTAGLPLGRQQGLLRVMTPDGGGTTQELAVAVNVMGLRRDPALLSWTIPRGASISATRPVELWNAGAGEMPFNVTADRGWLTYNPASGQSAGPGDRVAVAVGVTGAAGFTNGTHTGRVRLTAADDEGVVQTQQVSVSVTVFSPSAPHWLRATDGLYTNMVRVEWPATTGAVSYELRRGVLPDPGSAAALAMVAAPVTAYDDLTAAAGRQYYYWVRAVNAYGYAGSYSLMAGGWRRLRPPLSITATGNDVDKVRVEWTAAAGWPAGYELWRNESGGPGLRVGTTTGLQYDDAQATPGVRYYYWLRATNSLGVSASGPLAEGVRRLAQVQAAASEGDYPDRVRVSWAAVAGAQGYEVWVISTGEGSSSAGEAHFVIFPGSSRENSSSRENTWQLLATVTGRSYDDRAPVFGEGYAYRVRAVSQVSTGEYSQAVTGWLAPETIPTLFASEGLYTHHVWLSWDLLDGASDYELQRSATEDFADPELLKVLAGTRYEDAAALPGRRYYYRVKARHGNLYWYSRSGSGWRKLSPPAGVSASQGDFAPGIQVSWPAAEGADYYEVWSHTENDVFNATQMAQVVGREWVDATAALGAQRYYWVRSRSAVDVSDYSFSALGRAAMTAQLGGPGWTAVQGDFDGDGLADPAVYREADGAWQVLMSSAGYALVQVSGWGGPGWQPAPADYDGDGLTDPAVYREADGTWQVWLSGAGYALAQAVGWGGPGRQPVTGDYDGDGLSDPAVYREADGGWRVWLSGSDYAPVEVAGWGGAAWQPVAADYDGDGLTDPAVYREADGTWQVWLSGAGYKRTAVEGWGGPGWLPVTGDYDGDGLSDPAVYNPGLGRWWIWASGSGYQRVEIIFGGPYYQGLALDFSGVQTDVPVLYGLDDGMWWVRE